MAKNTDGNSKEITISKNSSEGNNGRILVIKEVGANSNYSYHYVPKYHTTNLGASAGMNFIMRASGNARSSEFVFIRDTTIEGHRGDGSNGNGVVVLCQVLSY